VREAVIITIRPPAWQTLAQAIDERRPVRARYHGAERILCPHALGWTNGRPKVLAYQVGGTTSRGTLPTDPRQRWRSMFVDEIEAPIITDGRWQTADNYRRNFNGIDHVEVELDDQTGARTS
jgi:WYL domain